MEISKSEKPEIIFSEPLEDIKQYQDKIKRINDRLREIAERKKEITGQIDDSLNYLEIVTSEGRDSVLTTLENLKIDIQSLTDEKSNLEEAREQYIALMRLAIEDDDFLQEQMDGEESGNA